MLDEPPLIVRTRGSGGRPDGTVIGLVPVRMKIRGDAASLNARDRPGLTKIIPHSRRIDQYSRPNVMDANLCTGASPAVEVNSDDLLVREKSRYQPSMNEARLPKRILKPITKS